MLQKQTIFYSFLAVSLGFFLYSCDSEEPQEPAQAEKPSQTISEPETAQKAKSDPEPELSFSLKLDSDPETTKKIKELIRKLEGKDERAAYDAALKLALMGDETAVEPLIRVYKRERGLMRVAALKALGSIGDKRALDILLEALNDKDLNIRRSAVSGLGNVGDESAIEPLIEALKDQDGWIRMDALGSLEKITKQHFNNYDAWKQWYQER